MHQLVPASSGSLQIANSVSGPPVVEPVVVTVKMPTGGACDRQAAADAVDAAGGHALLRLLVKLGFPRLPRF
jgi:hypothetical protein